MRFSGFSDTVGFHSISVQSSLADTSISPSEPHAASYRLRAASTAEKGRGNKSDKRKTEGNREKRQAEQEKC